MLWTGRALANLANWAIPGKRRAAVLLVANDRTRLALPLKDHPSIVHLVENGVDSATWQHRLEGRQTRNDTVFRLVFMGSLLSWKATDVTLEAVRLARGTGLDVRLDVLGDGAERHRLEALAVSMGLDHVVRFMGFRPQQECADILFSSDALILNSVLECGGAVVLEAMSVGLPVIASDWGGPADYLDADCGILVPPVPRADFAKRLSDAILRLAADPALRNAMGRAGQRKVRMHYDWHDKVGRMLDIYRYAMSLSESQAVPTQGWDSASIPPSSP
jgi:glycosyltransferase involved in cell wall biosynthesis